MIKAIAIKSFLLLDFLLLSLAFYYFCADFLFMRCSVLSTLLTKPTDRGLHHSEILHFISHVIRIILKREVEAPWGEE